MEEKSSFADFRSDTVTKPSAGMRKAMAEAEVGDDVWGDDPTINSLQERVATLFGKQDALFLPTSTMGNLISVLCHCPRGTAVILGNKCHINGYEAGGIAQMGGVFPIVVKNQPDGTLNLEEVEASVSNPNDVHQAQTRALCLENTHNVMGGAVLSLDYMKRAREVADKHGLKMHLDGARLLNAVTVLGVEPKEVTQYFDSINLCLSKGLGCPLGAMLVGSKEFIRRALFERKRLGGGMRQVGIIGAAGHYALDRWQQQLKQDHENMKFIADNVSKVAGGDKVVINQEKVETNILFCKFTQKCALSPKEVTQQLEKEHKIKVNLREDGSFRIVTHMDVKADDCKRFISALDSILK